jgi:peptidoglycan/xylan/chitin deacetylase (PgdA/CDA1 family)
MPKSTVCLSFDFDALSVWFGYERTTPAMLARGEYGARVGVPRVLELLERHQLHATFFVPGHTVESFPHETQSISSAVTRSHITRTLTSIRRSSHATRARPHGLRAGRLDRIGVRPLG